MKFDFRSMTKWAVVIIVTLLCIIVLGTCILIMESGLEYTVNDDGKTCTITGIGKYSSEFLHIPDAIGGYEVTAIADYAFKGTDISMVSGGNNITQIGKRAFQDCENLLDVILPQNLKTIEEGTFYNCTHLKSIRLPYGIIEIGDFAFYSCHRMTKINMPNALKTIGELSFGLCVSLENIVIPEGVSEIRQGAFYYCPLLTDIHFPASVVSVQGTILPFNNLSTINVDVNNTVLSSVDGNLYAYNNTVLVNYACAKPDISFEIPESVNKILTLSLAGCTNLKNISIPKGVTYIGDQIFCNSPNIEVIYYEGTIEDWRRIDKEDGWKDNTESMFTIICTDGEIAKDGRLTYK